MDDLNIKNSSRLVASLWELHDKRNFSALKKNANELFVCLGYGKKSSNIAYHITRAYLLHAEMDDLLLNKAINQDTYKKIKIYKIKISKEMTIAFKIGRIKNADKLARHHAQWWTDFFMKNLTENKIYYIPTLWHLFFEQYIKLGNLRYAVFATQALYKSSVNGHNKRMHKELIQNLSEFWRIISLIDNRPFMF
jgi:hypothetical protein